MCVCRGKVMNAEVMSNVVGVASMYVCVFQGTGDEC